jgi:hypothetical protein
MDYDKFRNEIVLFNKLWDTVTSVTDIDSGRIALRDTSRIDWGADESAANKEIAKLPIGIVFKAITNSGIRSLYLNTKLGPITATLVTQDTVVRPWINTTQKIYTFGFVTTFGLQVNRPNLRHIFGYTDVLQASKNPNISCAPQLRYPNISAKINKAFEFFTTEPKL